VQILSGVGAQPGLWHPIRFRFDFFKVRPEPHQITAVFWAIRAWATLDVGFCADEQGLGKTFTAYAFGRRDDGLPGVHSQGYRRGIFVHVRSDSSIRTIIYAPTTFPILAQILHVKNGTFSSGAYTLL
jgi:hypothetical protein